LGECPRGGCWIGDVPLVTCRMRVSLFRVVRPCGGGARTISSPIQVARQMHWLLDVHSTRSAACVRISSSFTVLVRPNSLGFTSFLFSSAPSIPYVKRNGLGSVTVTVPIMVPTGRHNDSLSLTDQSSIPSISTTSTTLNPDSATEKLSLSDTMSSYHSAKSFHELEMQGLSSPLAGILLTSPPASVPPHFSDASESTMPVHASSSVETV
jgi:hypothetical protein